MTVKRMGLVVCMMAVGGVLVAAGPRFLEQLAIGGGYGDAKDGGALLSANGDIATDGQLTVDGSGIFTQGVAVTLESGFTGDVTLGLREQAERVSNSGMEGGYVSGVAPFWTAVGASITPSEETTDVYAGVSSQKIITGPDFNQLRTSLTEPDGDGNDFVAGAWYVLSFAAKIQSGNLNKVSVWGDGVEEFSNFDSRTAGVWTVYSYTFQSTATRADAILFFTNNTANPATYLLDSVTFKRVKGGDLIATHGVHSGLGYGAGGATLDAAGNGDFSGNGIFDRDVTASGGDLAAGADSTARGIVSVWDGSGGAAPGTIRLGSPNGTQWYLFVEDDGTVKVHSALPTLNTDGAVVGSQF
jgi:hypothetical protein